MEKPKQMPLRHMPAGIHRYLVAKQAEYRNQTGLFVGLERIIYQIIREKMELDNDQSAQM